MKDSNNPEKELNILQRIGLELLWATCRVMNYSPRWFRFYMFKPFAYALLRLLRYRRKVINKNLELCFPDYTPKERKRIMRRFYDTLAEVIVDTICLAGATPKRDGKCINWSNGKEHLERIKGKDWVALASHFGCWEYDLLWTWQDPDSIFMGVYHTMRSQVFECFYRRLRNFSPSIEQVPMRETVRYYMKHRGQGRNITLGLISDQSPLLTVDTAWYDFFGQPTAFVDGGERIAMKYSLPVYFVYVKRIAAGRYDIRFDELYDGHEEVEPHEITRRYAKALEAMIRETPELWLWSHNRWRHTPAKQEALKEKVKNGKI